MNPLKKGHDHIRFVVTVWEMVAGGEELRREEKLQRCNYGDGSGDGEERKDL